MTVLGPEQAPAPLEGHELQPLQHVDGMVQWTCECGIGEHVLSTAAAHERHAGHVAFERKRMIDEKL